MPHSEADLITLADWRNAYLDGASVRELVPARARRLADQSPAEAWIHRCDDTTLMQRAQALDAGRDAASGAERRERLQRLPLFGVPFAVKDNIDVAGLPTSAACPAFGYRATRSATVVQRLLDAGAVLLGKCNLDQFATGLVGTRSPYGAPASVLAADRISGGSSSGSAVVVGRGDVPFALGTDTAGSGRVPAAFNQIVGLKPTRGRVSTAGVVPACRSLDCVSVFALDVDDAAGVLALIEGDDAADEYGAYATGRASWPTPLRVGVPTHPVLADELGYRSAWHAAEQRLAALGAVAVPVDIEPLCAIGRMLYDGPWVAERYAVVQALLDADPAALDPAVAGVIARARGLTAVDTFRAQYALRRAARDAAALWRDVDVLMVPTAPRHPRFDEVAADPVGVNAQLGLYTNFVNLLGWCALALPASTAAHGLPFGVTFIAPGAADAALAHWGRRWQQACALPLGATGRRPGAGRAPGPAPASTPTLALAVVGAHLSGLPLNGQLTERGATLRARTHTAPHYRLYALPGTRPPKPGLQRVREGGVAIELEVWDLPIDAVGSLLALVPSPLGIGSIELADGLSVHGFLCEPFALEGAADISGHGGWRAYLAAQ